MRAAIKSILRAIQTIFLMLAILCLANACTNLSNPPGEELSALDGCPEIFPDYTAITIPANMAALNFRIMEEGEAFMAFLEGSNGEVIRMKNRSLDFYSPAAQWKKFMADNQGGRYKVRIYKKEKGEWQAYDPIINQIATDLIDPFLAYRLIPPGYETWSSMGLYQRDLTSFREDPIIENKHIEDNCVNCHSFAKGSPENMMFHIRGSLGGTMIKKGNEIRKVDLNREESLSAGVYPSWHPSGDYIAYSTNKIEQYFHAHPEHTIEVLDRHSDLVLYHTNTGELTHVPGTRGDSYMETFPSWSPDGKYLYYSRTDAQAETPFDSIRYDIYRIGFDPDHAQFGEAEPVLLVTGENRSASFPRISPDGKYLLGTVHNYGTFPIWHKEADLCLVNLENGEVRYPAKINSDASDSFHSWSSNSRWIVFSSRRYDGQYTKLYISHMNKKGEFQKPFLLPQRSPGFYDAFFYSYNVPELVTEKIAVNPRKWVKAANR